jgi:hypothetical protein
MEWTESKLWELRLEIKLNSLFVSDYGNTFGVDPKVACDFFDGYMDYLEDELHPDGKTFDDLNAVFALDNPENLWKWYNCFADESPLPTIPKKFWITFEVNGGIEVEAEDEDEARRKFVRPIGEAMLNAIDSNVPHITDVERIWE